MSTVIMIAQLILGLSILVVLHELGHFLAARAFGIRVEKFYLFFDAWGFKLLKFKKGDTEYGIGWLPLGGYVKISGMIDESMDKEQLKQPPQPWEFRSKPAWQRLIVMIGGVTVNLILGILIFAFILLNYEKSYLSVDSVNKDGIYAAKAGRDAGFLTGDKILTVNGKNIDRFKDAQSIRLMFGSKVEVERKGTKVEIVIPDNFYKTETKAQRSRFVEPYNFALVIDSVLADLPAAKAGVLKGDKVIGIDTIVDPSYGQFRDVLYDCRGKQVAMNLLRGTDTVNTQITIDSLGIVGILAKIPYQPKDYGFGSALVFGYRDAIDMLVVNIKGLGKVFKGEEKATDSIQGPIGIAKIYGAEWIWSKFWFITGLLSLVLAFMNILPIPALDGGHVVFLTWEIISRRKPSDKFLEYAQIAGMVILIGIMAFAVGNDLFKIFK